MDVNKANMKYEEATSTESPACQQEPPRLPLRMIQTFGALFSWLCMGLFAEISGPTLTFLKDRIDATYEEISRALVARSVGYLVGTLVGGILSQRWNRLINLWIGFALVVGGAATVFQPWSDGLVLLAFLFFLDGLGKGVVATAGNALIFNLWKKKAAVPTQALHGCFGIGALIAPQLVKPFLPDYSAYDIDHSCQTSPGHSQVNSSSSEVTSTEGGNSTHCVDSVEHIEYAYLVAGSCAVLGALVLLVIHYMTIWKTQAATQAHKLADKGTGQGILHWIRQNQCFAPVLLGLFFVLYALPVGMERAYGKFIFAYSTDSQLRFPPKRASDLVMVFWVTFTAGRLLASLMSRWLSPLRLLLLELTLGVSSSALLSFWASREPIVLWLGTAFFAASLSPICPGAICWTNLYIPMTPVLTSFAFIATAAGSISFSYISGYLFQYTGPQSLMYLSMAYTVSALTLVIIIAIIIRVSGVFAGDHKEHKQEELEEMNTGF